jgi:glycerate-2-kinase
LAGLIASGPLAQPATTRSPAERIAIVFKVILPPDVILPEAVR